MIDLTEQWKKGELPEGWYYVKCDDGICFDRFTYYGGFSKIFNYSVKQILAAVPPYEVYKELIDGRKLLREYIKDITNENAQLKELLKEWVQFEIEENPNDFTVMSERMSQLANKTKEVLK